MARVILYDLRIDWSRTGTFVDETSRLLRASGSMKLAAPESSISSPKGMIDQCQIILNNSDGRFSPLKTTSPLYDDIKLGNCYHAPMYLRVSVDNGSNYSRIFTGVIKLPVEGPPYPGVASTVTIDCRSRDEIILNARQSTTLADFRSLHDNDSTEAEVIANFLESTGLTSADYTLDPGLFVIDWAWLDDESPLEDIWVIAAACGGRFYCDPDGEFRYENMTHWLFSPHTVSQETLDQSGYSRMEGPIYDDTELFSGVTVTASPRDLDETVVVWESDQIITVAAGNSRVITAKLRQPIYQLDSVEFTAVTGGARNMDSSITITRTDYAQRVVLTITNANAEYSADIISLKINGIPVNGAPSVEESATSDKTFWTSYATYRPGRVKPLRGNVYIQNVGQAVTLANFLKDRYQLPRLFWRLRSVPGKPSRRLGDRITVNNNQAMSASEDAFLIGIDWRCSSQGFTQDLYLMHAGNIADGNGLYPYDDYFIIGTNELGDNTNPDGGRVFY